MEKCLGAVVKLQGTRDGLKVQPEGCEGLLGGSAARGEMLVLHCQCHHREMFLNITCSYSSGPFCTPVTNAHLALSSSPPPL